MTRTAKEGELEGYNQRIDEVLSLVNQLEQRVEEVEQFYSKKSFPDNSRATTSVRIKDKEKGNLRTASSINKQQQDAADRGAASVRMDDDLIRQCGTILDQITRHQFVWPFMEPVQVERLGLHDYREIIEKPMDLGTIKKKMKAGKYRHVREVCADVRLVFKNAMEYNDERNLVHVMAKILLAKFEEKWLSLLVRITEEEKGLKEELKNYQVAKEEAAYGKKAKELCIELYELDTHLDELRDMVVQKLKRKMSSEEKRQIGTALTQLSMEDLGKALDIVAQGNPGFQLNAEEVDLDIDALTETTLWRLKFFVKSVVLNQGNPPLTTSGGGCNNNNRTQDKSNSKRKRKICNAIIKTAKKRSKKVDA